MPRPKVYDESLRRRLIDLTAEALAAAGPDALSLRALAKEAGTSTSAVYAFFADKEGLVEATVADALDSFSAAQRAVLRRSPEAHEPRREPDDLRRLGRAYRDWALANPALCAVVFGPKVVRRACADVDRAHGAAFRPLLDVVTDLVAAGVFRDGDPERIALSIWATTHGAVVLELSEWAGSPWAAAFFEEHLDAIERAWSIAGDS